MRKITCFLLKNHKYLSAVGSFTSRPPPLVQASKVLSPPPEKSLAGYATDCKFLLFYLCFNQSRARARAAYLGASSVYQGWKGGTKFESLLVNYKNVATSCLSNPYKFGLLIHNHSKIHGFIMSYQCRGCLVLFYEFETKRKAEKQLSRLLCS